MKTRLIKFYLRYLNNRYFYITVIFLIWMIFFDTNNLIDRHKNVKKINQMEQEIEYFKHRIETDKINLEELKTNPEVLEKFAREKYLMKNKNEDIFIITR